VATRSTIRGRHDGELMGAAATGRDVEFTALTISRCRDGKIEEEWELVDAVGLLRQIGALPEMAEA
jgi:predicted ester cyclase